MVTKTELHRLIDALPDDMLPIAAEFLSELETDASAPYVPLHEAPIDDEPVTEEELAAIAEGRAAFARGDFVRDEDLDPELGL